MVARGFTLIELCVALAIIAILVAIGVPQYQKHVQVAKQAQAKVLLLEIIETLERQFFAGESEEQATNLIAHYDNADYQFGAEQVADAGIDIWRATAKPLGNMQGSGSLGVDSRGFSCFSESSNSGCIPSDYESW